MYLACCRDVQEFAYGGASGALLRLVERICRQAAHGNSEQESKEAAARAGFELMSSVVELPSPMQDQVKAHCGMIWIAPVFELLADPSSDLTTCTQAMRLLLGLCVRCPENQRSATGGQAQVPARLSIACSPASLRSDRLTSDPLQALASFLSSRLPQMGSYSLQADALELVYRCTKGRSLQLGAEEGEPIAAALGHQVAEQILALAERPASSIELETEVRRLVLAYNAALADRAPLLCLEATRIVLGEFDTASDPEPRLWLDLGTQGLSFEMPLQHKGEGEALWYESLPWHLLRLPDLADPQKLRQVQEQGCIRLGVRQLPERLQGLLDPATFDPSNPSHRLELHLSPKDLASALDFVGRIRALIFPPGSTPGNDSQEVLRPPSAEGIDDPSNNPPPAAAPGQPQPQGTRFKMSTARTLYSRQPLAMAPSEDRSGSKDNEEGSQQLEEEEALPPASKDTRTAGRPVGGSQGHVRKKELPEEHPTRT